MMGIRDVWHRNVIQNDVHLWEVADKQLQEAQQRGLYAFPHAILVQSRTIHRIEKSLEDGPMDEILAMCDTPAGRGIPHRECIKDARFVEILNQSIVTIDAVHLHPRRITDSHPRLNEIVGEVYDG